MEGLIHLNYLPCLHDLRQIVPLPSVYIQMPIGLSDLPALAIGQG